MGVVKFEIIIDQPDKIYKPGETVTGRVELVLDSEKKMRGVEVKITGKAKCKWKETRTTTSGGKVTRKTVTKQSKEIYIRKEIVLCGEGEKFRLPMGAYTYPFSVILPHQLPSSFNGKYGSVSYYAKAKIDIPMAIDEVRKEWFTVVNLLDLNYKPDLKNPIKKEEHKTFCCLCCKSGPLSIVLLLPKTGFAKSEPIPVTLELDNASDLAVNGINVRLERLIEYKAQGSTKEENTNLQTLNLDGVAKGKSYACSESLTIPPMDYPNIGNCPIIQFYYSVQVEAVVSDLHKNLKIEQYITIGDIPLSEVSNFPNVDPNIQQWPNNLPVMPGIQQRIIPLNPFEGPSIEPEGDSKETGYPGGMPVPGIAQPVPPPAVPAQILPNTGFDSPNLYPNVELKQHSPQNGTNDTAQSLYSPQPSINPEYAEIVQNSDPRMKSDFGALDSDFSLPKFTTSDIQIEKSSFLSDSKKTKDNENDATQFTPLLSSSPSSTTTS